MYLLSILLRSSVFPCHDNIDHYSLGLRVVYYRKSSRGIITYEIVMVEKKGREHQEAPAPRLKMRESTGRAWSKRAREPLKVSARRHGSLPTMHNVTRLDMFLCGVTLVCVTG